MVVLVNDEKPSKKRIITKYKVKTVVGPDDYASMRIEVINGAIVRVIQDGLTPPDLIVIDDGLRARSMSLKK